LQLEGYRRQIFARRKLKSTPRRHSNHIIA
jgi:hypothetical protein